MTEPPAVYTVEEAADLLRIGRTAAYEAARRGDLPVVRIGRTIRIPRHRLAALLDPQNDEAQAMTPALRETSAARREGHHGPP